MPYYKRRYRRRPYRRYRRRKRFYTGAQKFTGDKSAAGFSAKSVGQAAWGALKLANQIRGIVNVEKKWVDTNVAAYAQSTTATIEPLNVMAKGDTHSDREGDKILMQSLQVTGTITRNADCAFAVYIILDRECAGALPAYTDIFESSGATSTNYRALRNRDYTDRFKILKKKIWHVNANRTVVDINEFVKLKIHTKYFKNQNAGTIADISDNALYIVTISSIAASTPTFSYNARMTFTDN